jgi:putative membrane protein
VLAHLATTWELSPVPIAVAGVALLLYAQAFARLRRRGRRDHASVASLVLFVAGISVLTLALVSPLDSIGEDYLLSVHMTQHVLIGDVAPMLLMLAIRGPISLFVVPPPLLRVLARPRALRSTLRFLLRPSVGFASWALAIAAWHVPVAYDYALDHPFAHDLEHASFMLTGCLVWSQLFDPGRRRALSPNGRVAYALGLVFAGHAVVHPLLFGSGTLYARYAAQHERLLGLSPVADQRAAALVMTVDQVLTFGTFIAVSLLARRRASRPQPAQSAYSDTYVIGR